MLELLQKRHPKIIFSNNDCYISLILAGLDIFTVEGNTDYNDLIDRALNAAHLVLIPTTGELCRTNKIRTFLS